MIWTSKKQGLFSTVSFPWMEVIDMPFELYWNVWMLSWKKLTATWWHVEVLHSCPSQAWESLCLDSLDWSYKALRKTIWKWNKQELCKHGSRTVRKLQAVIPIGSGKFPNSPWKKSLSTMGSWGQSKQTVLTLARLPEWSPWTAMCEAVA